ncbi:Galectin [Meloidogyne graminicola]|uniref:Galectin n=1 Tax=Meloidogyne graminicola TaxID=189291 RepID=A0A8T0A1V3_9BILA|nr:Galectin [Meloidogyne graminicola]
MSHPLINHISVPYTARLLSELQPPQTLLIQGDVLPDANRFAINLLSDCTEVNPHMGSVPLHVNIRFDENSVVLNSFNAGEWEKEERHSNPFNRGEPFDIRIRVHEERFELIANKQHLADFKHRYSFRKINHMQIIGDITLSTVHWGGRYFEMPFQSTFHGDSLKSGQRVFVYSIAKGDFSVNFVGENGDMLFHLNPRFTENQIVRGSQKNGTWGEEEREGKFPLKKGEAVDIAIHNEPYSIQVFINGNHYCTFAHRIEDPNNEYKFLRIEGNIELTGVEVSQ